MSVAHTFLFAVGNSMTTWGKLPELPGVARDVDKIFDAIVEGGPGLGLADCSLSVKLLDKGVREVKERWEEFIEAVEIDALVVFYFAGHGALVGEHDLRLLLADSERSRKDGSTLPVLQVIRALENKSVAEWAVILDCCESSEATRDRAIQGARNRTNSGSLIACATSSGSTWETPEHGARFTSRLTEAIRTGSCMPPGSEFVDILRAATWAKDQLPEPRPLVDHWGSADLRVARTPGPGVSAGAVVVGATTPVPMAPSTPGPGAGAGTAVVAPTAPTKSRGPGTIRGVGRPIQGPNINGNRSSLVPGPPASASKQTDIDSTNIILDVPALVGRTRAEVDTLLGRPDHWEAVNPSGVGPDLKCTYRSGNVEIVFLAGRADWITVNDLQDVEFSPRSIGRFGFPVLKPTDFNPSVIRWRRLSEMLEVVLWPGQGGGCHFLYVKAFSS